MSEHHLGDKIIPGWEPLPLSNEPRAKNSRFKLTLPQTQIAFLKKILKFILTFLCWISIEGHFPTCCTLHWLHSYLLLDFSETWQIVSSYHSLPAWCYLWLWKARRIALMLREGVHKSGWRLKQEFLIWYQITPFMVIAVTKDSDRIKSATKCLSFLSNSFFIFLFSFNAMGIS